MIWILLILGLPLPIVLLLSLPTPENFWRTLAITGLTGIVIYLACSVIIGTILARKREYVDNFPTDDRRKMYTEILNQMNK